MIILSPEHLQLVRQILAEHIPECEVRVFGSRVKETQKPYADLDLVVIGARLAQAQLDELAESFIESDLPFRVDVLDWNRISEAFRAEIDAGYEVIQEPQSAPSPSLT